MRQPSHSMLRLDITTLEGAIGRIEAAMMGFRFSGYTAKEIDALAERLKRLTVPHKGLNDRTVFPAVELDPAPPISQLARAAE